MDEPATGRVIPWGSLLTIAALSGLLVALLRLGPVVSPAIDGLGVGIACAMAAAGFLVGRWLLNYFWGLVLALGLALHPVFLDALRADLRSALQETLALAGLALLVLGWRLAFRPQGGWAAWPALLAGMSGVVGLAWQVSLRVGAVLSAAGVVGLGLAFVLAMYRRRRPERPQGPAAVNAVLALLVGLLVPAGSLLAAATLASLHDELARSGLPVSAVPPRVETWEDLLLPWRLAGAEMALLDSLAALSADAAQVWGWPLPWLMVPLAGFGLGRAVRSGWKTWAVHRPPLGWVVVVFTLLDVAGLALFRAESLLPLAVLTAFLSVYCVGDVIRGVAERMVLTPP
jgi:hypothetical protein